MGPRRPDSGLMVVPLGEGELELSWPDPHARTVTVVLVAVGIVGGAVAVTNLPEVVGLGGVLLALAALVIGANRAGPGRVRMQLISRGITVSGRSPFRVEWRQVSAVAITGGGGRVAVRIRTTVADDVAGPEHAVVMPKAAAAAVARSVEHWTGRPVAVPMDTHEGH